MKEGFIEQMRLLLGEEESSLFLASMQQEPVVSVRKNVRKYRGNLNSDALVAWNYDGAYFPVRPQFTFDPLMHAGAYYVQDASSMILQTVVSRLLAKLPDKTDKIRYLDACAAPGGKTTAAINALPNDSLVVANEFMTQRAKVLAENVAKCGYENAIVTNNDTLFFSALSHFFDIVAADVPCSGEGMMRKDADAVNQWSESLIADCASLQRTIVDNVWNSIRPGGFLIYSTCTFNLDENEKNIEYIVEKYGAETVDLDFPHDWKIRGGFAEKFHCYRFMPHITEGEGLFLCVVRKPNDTARFDWLASVSGAEQLPKKQKRVKPVAVPDYSSLLVVPSCTVVDIDNDGNGYSNIPLGIFAEYNALRKRLNVVSAGVKVGSHDAKRGELVPATELAYSVALHTDAYPKVELDYRTAISYLRGEGIIVDAPRGYIIVCYHGFALGFAKSVGNRANSLYPKDWRIRSTYAPNDAPIVLKFDK